MKNLFANCLNIPNILSVFRIGLIFVFAKAFLNNQYYYALFIYVVAGLTDVIDGFIARKFNLTTELGKLLDPLADKLLQLTAISLLTYRNIIPWPIITVVAIKELAMIIGATFLLQYKDYVVQADWFGKLATVIFFVAVVGCIFADRQLFGAIIPYDWKNAMMVIAVCTTLFAFYGYCLMFFKVLKQSKNKQIGDD